MARVTLVALLHVEVPDEDQRVWEREEGRVPAAVSALLRAAKLPPVRLELLHGTVYTAPLVLGPVRWSGDHAAHVLRSMRDGTRVMAEQERATGVPSPFDERRRK